MAIPASHSFTFQAQELPHKLCNVSRGLPIGSWLCEVYVTHKNTDIEPWYLGLSQGQVLFSGNQQFSWQMLLMTLQRYVPYLRSDRAKQAILTLEEQLIPNHQETRTSPIPHLLQQLQALNLITAEEMVKALRLKILSDFDHYLFGAGQAQFLQTPQLELQSVASGFEIEELISEAIERQAWWRRLQPQIPSMDSVPILNAKAVQNSLTPQQQQRLESLVASGTTLANIAVAVAQDPLEIAKVFAKLISEGLVTLQSSVRPSLPTILVIDDSPLLLKQFESLVTSWGYAVQSFSDPNLGLQALMRSRPSVIFLDINMPGITGFDLVKQIRRQPDLLSVPLIMLTAEKTLSNNWRARWSGCRFLSKPLTPSEIQPFQMELRMLLAELAPLEPQRVSYSHGAHSFNHHYQYGNS